MSTEFLDELTAEALFPKARRLVLGLLYTRPDKAFYLREVVENTGLGVGHAQRELGRLAKGLVIRRWKEGRHVFFQANVRSPAYKELLSLVTKTLGIAGVLREALLPLASGIRSAFVYGSVARGEARESSDVDLLVIGEVSFAEVTRLVRPVESRIDREVHPTVYGVHEFRAKVAEGNHFIRSVLNAPKVFVQGDDDELGRLLA